MTEKKKTLYDSWISRLKNNRLIAILLIAALVVGGIAQFTESLEKIRSVIPWFEKALPDLKICDIDIENKQIDICNFGTAAAPTKDLFLAFSQSWYVKPEWNHKTNVGLLRYIDNQDIEAGTKLAVGILSLKDTDAGTEFMIDVLNVIDESDETNNCVKLDGSVINCRPRRLPSNH